MLLYQNAFLSQRLIAILFSICHVALSHANMFSQETGVHNSKSSFFENKSKQNLACYYSIRESDRDARALRNQALAFKAIANEYHNCPFADLNLMENATTSLLQPHNLTHKCARRSQLGIAFHSIRMRSSRTARVDSAFVQALSSRVAFGRQFLPEKLFVANDEGNHLDLNDGLTFEMIFRRKDIAKDHAETLFTIKNEYHTCSGLLIQLQIIPNGAFVLKLSVPIAGEPSNCYELHFYSARVGNKCLLPKIVTQPSEIDFLPVVHIFVKLFRLPGQNSFMVSRFFLDYTDPLTMQHVRCNSDDTVRLPRSLDIDMQGIMSHAYRLFIGNCPNDTMKRLQKLPSPRIYRDPYDAASYSTSSAKTHRQSASGKLREMLMHALQNIQGPRIRAAARMFRHRQFSLQLLGWRFPPITADTPLSWVRDKIEQFKNLYGSQIVDVLVRSITKAEKMVQGASISEFIRNRLGRIFNKSNSTTPTKVKITTIDFFGFGMYQKVLGDEEVWESMANLVPLRRPMQQQVDVHIPSGTKTLVDLSTLSSVYTNTCIELLEPLPKLGRLYFIHDGRPVSSNNMHLFRELSMASGNYSIHYSPEPSQTYVTAKSSHKLATEPYASILFAKCEVSRSRRKICDLTSKKKVGLSNYLDRQINILTDTLQDHLSSGAKHTIERERNGDIIARVHIYINGSAKVLHQDPKMLFYDVKQDVPLLINLSTALQTHLSGPMKIRKLPQFGSLYDTQSLCAGRHRSWNNCIAGVLGTIDDFIAECEPRRILNSTVHNRQGISLDNETITIRPAFIYLYTRSQSRNAPPDMTSANGTLLDEMQFTLDESGTQAVTGNIHIRLRKTLSAEDMRVINIVAQEDSITLIYLQQLVGHCGPPCLNAFYKVRSLTKRGRLYHYQDVDTYKAQSNFKANGTQQCSHLLSHLDRPVQVNDIVTDRIMYVPHLNDFTHSELGYDKFLRSDIQFTFLPIHPNQGLHRKLAEPTKVSIQILNEEDKIYILPPYRKSLVKDHTLAAFPIHYIDYDSHKLNDDFTAVYLVHLVSEDRSAEFEFPDHEFMTKEAIYKHCNGKHVCSVPRSLKRAVSASVGSIEVLAFGLVYAPYDLYFLGSASAVAHALRSLHMDVSSIRWERSHDSTFTLSLTKQKISKSSEYDRKCFTEAFLSEIVAAEPSAKARFLLQIDRDISKWRGIQELLGFDKAWDLILVKLQNGGRKVFMTMIIVHLSGLASCFFCCSCCCRTRQDKAAVRRQKEHTEYHECFVNNDMEYSQLIVQLTDMLLHQNFGLAICAVRACFNSSRAKRYIAQQEAYLCLQSLYPIYDFLHMEIAFSLRILHTEGKIFRYTSHRPSTSDPKNIPLHALHRNSITSLVLYTFFQRKGEKWIRLNLQNCLNHFLSIGAKALTDETITAHFLHSLHRNLRNMPLDLASFFHETIPVLISFYCGGEAEAYSDTYRTQIAGHFLFFTHYLSPWLCANDGVWHYCSKVYRKDISDQTEIVERQRISQAIVSQLEKIARTWIHYADIENHYERMVSYGRNQRDISSSIRYEYSQFLQKLSNAYICDYNSDRTLRTEQDDELIAVCLMNMHSIIDSHQNLFLHECKFYSVMMKMDGLCSKCKEHESSTSFQNHPCCARGQNQDFKAYQSHLKALLSALDIPYANTDEILSYLDRHGEDFHALRRWLHGTYD